MSVNSQIKQLDLCVAVWAPHHILLLWCRFTHVISTSSSFLSFTHYLSKPLPYRCFYVIRDTWTLQSHDLSGEGINSGSYTYFFDHTRTWRASRMKDQLNAEATSQTTRTWKMMCIIHELIFSNKANMKGWLWRPNDIRGLCGPKAFRHLSYRWGRTPRKISPRKFVLTGDQTRACCVTGVHATTCSTGLTSINLS